MDVAVTQITSTTTAVDANGISGVITTFTLANAAGVISAFTVNNTGIKVGNGVIATIMDYAGTTGTPAVYIDDIAEDQFKVNVVNTHASAALNGVAKVAFLII